MMNAPNDTGALPREQTFLRVKRRRNENPPSTIRLELLGGWNIRRQDENDVENNFANNNNLAPPQAMNNLPNGHPAYPLRSSSTATLTGSQNSFMSTSTTQTTNVTSNANNPFSQSQAIRNSNNYCNPPRRTHAAAVWKRVEDAEGENPFTSTGEKRCRVVDAILEGDGRSSKRRKLTVLGEASSDQLESSNKKSTVAKKQNIYKVLDPVTRIVDDSLTMVQAGDRSIGEHYTLVTTDPRLATHARKWLSYTNRGGNLLHACAQWNDVESAHDLLRQSLSNLVDAVDQDGKTPYEAAQLCGHESIVEIFEAFGADTTNYVYDMFVPEEIQTEIPVPLTTATESNNKLGQSKSDNDDWNPLEKTPINQDPTNNLFPSTDGAVATANGSANVPPQQQQPPPPPDFTELDASRLLELQGGVGYWTEEGELILEVEPHHMLGVADHDSDDEYGDEEDIDSNCEDYGGNDYPDEDEFWEEEFLREEPLVGDDDDSSLGHIGGEDDVW